MAYIDGKEVLFSAEINEGADLSNLIIPMIAAYPTYAGDWASESYIIPKDEYGIYIISCSGGGKCKASFQLKNPYSGEVTNYNTSEYSYIIILKYKQWYKDQDYEYESNRVDLFCINLSIKEQVHFRKTSLDGPIFISSNDYQTKVPNIVRIKMGTEDLPPI